MTPSEGFQEIPGDFTPLLQLPKFMTIKEEPQNQLSFWGQDKNTSILQNREEMKNFTSGFLCKFNFPYI